MDAFQDFSIPAFLHEGVVSKTRNGLAEVKQNLSGRSPAQQSGGEPKREARAKARALLDAGLPAIRLLSATVTQQLFSHGNHNHEGKAHEHLRLLFLLGNHHPQTPGVGLGGAKDIDCITSTSSRSCTDNLLRRSGESKT